MRSLFLNGPSWTRLLALYVLALATVAQLGACKGDDDDDGDQGHDHDSGSEESPCADDHDHDHDADHDAEGDGGEEPDHDAEQVGPPSGATCPSDNKLDYDSFGKDFMMKYCTRCHSSKLTECADRMNAPFGHDFDTFPGIIGVADHIDQMAAAGPDHTNKTMPPDGAKPSDDERKQLGQWLACELEKLNN
jgi:hypothetical protein